MERFRFRTTIVSPDISRGFCLGLGKEPRQGSNSLQDNAFEAKRMGNHKDPLR